MIINLCHKIYARAFECEDHEVTESLYKTLIIGKTFLFRNNFITLCILNRLSIIALF